MMRSPGQRALARCWASPTSQLSSWVREFGTQMDLQRQLDARADVLELLQVWLSPQPASPRPAIDWHADHTTADMPPTMSQVPGAGRGLFASKDLHQGSVIHEEAPIAAAPSAHSLGAVSRAGGRRAGGRCSAHGGTHLVWAIAHVCASRRRLWAGSPSLGRHAPRCPHRRPASPAWHPCRPAPPRPMSPPTALPPARSTRLPRAGARCARARWSLCGSPAEPTGRSSPSWPPSWHAR
jgi:hypothetical protein